LTDQQGSENWVGIRLEVDRVLNLQVLLGDMLIESGCVKGENDGSIERSQLGYQEVGSLHGIQALRDVPRRGNATRGETCEIEGLLNWPQVGSHRNAEFCAAKLDGTWVRIDLSATVHALSFHKHLAVGVLWEQPCKTQLVQGFEISSPLGTSVPVWHVVEVGRRRARQPVAKYVCGTPHELNAMLRRFWDNARHAPHNGTELIVGTIPMEERFENPGPVGGGYSYH